jgi:uncharacterized protein
MGSVHYTEARGDIMKKLLLLFILMQASQVHANELAQSPSPYLAMHGSDPVDWHDINSAVLEKARKEQKMIFVSSGYYACHWCHVMQRESYQDPKIAAFLNRHFIAVKVDRELNPVLDARLIDFVEQTNGRAGWPLNVFLTPEGYPFFGLTYSPPDGFLKLLTKLAKLWAEDPDSLRVLSQAAFEEMQDTAGNNNQRVSNVNPGALKKTFISSVQQFQNDMEGGFGNGNKFPHVPQLVALLELGAQEEFLRLTLDAMATQHLNDHLNGGFFRYTTDPDWQTPHFEKMLYDNALLASLYLKAGVLLGDETYTQTGIATLHFMAAHMQYDQGGYVASLSAVDNNGVEGGYYLWNEKQLEQTLDKNSLKLLHDVWGMDAPSRFEAGYLPTSIATSQHHQQLEKIYDQLRSVRQKETTRQLPVDDKRLSSWNGLVLSALALCFRTGDRQCKQDGERQAQFLLDIIRKHGLVHGLDRDGGSLGDATLEDYAYVIQGLTDWGRQTANASMLETARRLLHQASKRFHRPNGWMASQHSVLPGIQPMHNLPDTVLPSPTSSLLFSDLALSADAENKRQANSITGRAIVTQSVVDNPFSYSGVIVFLLNRQKTNSDP